MFKLLKVSGPSLLPMYRDGDFVLVSKIPYLFGRVRRGDVVVFRHNVYGTMIKIVDSVTPGADKIRVTGTHEYSIDSKDFGVISKKDIVGKVIWHIKKRDARRGAV